MNNSITKDTHTKSTTVGRLTLTSRVTARSTPACTAHSVAACGISFSSLPVR